jgi:hypothetical protein
MEDAALSAVKGSLAFDMFLFCTSLDHIEDLDACAAAVKSVAAAGATCVFWVGLHDPDIVAAPEGGFVFRNLIRLHPLVSLIAYFGYGILRFPGLVWRMAWRKRDLREGRRLDNLHFWYFTRNTISDVFKKFGETEEILLIPHSNHIFVRVKISHG